MRRLEIQMHDNASHGTMNDIYAPKRDWQNPDAQLMASHIRALHTEFQNYAHPNPAPEVDFRLVGNKLVIQGTTVHPVADSNLIHCIQARANLTGTYLP